MIQLRRKGGDPGEALRLGEALRAITGRRGALLIVNDDVDLAIGCGADGVHLGPGDLSLSAARKRAGASLIIGASCKGSLGLARAAADAGADYVSFGALYPTATKPEASACSPEIFAQARSEIPGVPLVAIGGITPRNAAEAAATGADAFAVCAGLFGEGSITIAAKLLAKELDGKRSLN